MQITCTGCPPVVADTASDRDLESEPLEPGLWAAVLQAGSTSSPSLPEPCPHLTTSCTADAPSATRNASLLTRADGPLPIAPQPSAGPATEGTDDVGTPAVLTVHALHDSPVLTDTGNGPAPEPGPVPLSPEFEQALLSESVLSDDVEPHVPSQTAALPARSADGLPPLGSRIARSVLERDGPDHESRNIDLNRSSGSLTHPLTDDGDRATDGVGPEGEGVPGAEAGPSHDQSPATFENSSVSASGSVANMSAAAVSSLEPGAVRQDRSEPARLAAEIAAQESAGTPGEEQVFVFRFSPPDLGDVRVRLSQVRGGLRIAITVDGKHVTAMHEQVPQIREALERHDVRVADFDVTPRHADAQESFPDRSAPDRESPPTVERAEQSSRWRRPSTEPEAARVAGPGEIPQRMLDFRA